MRVIIPDSVTSIGIYVFFHNNLTSIEILQLETLSERDFTTNIRGGKAMTSMLANNSVGDIKEQSEVENPLDDLTPRELEVLLLLINGGTNREIANELFLSTNTIRIYLSNIYAKLDVGTRTQAAIIAVENKY